MKYIKTFESKNKTPEVGDYVICEDDFGNEIITNFISSTAGKIKKKLKGNLDSHTYLVYYENAPNIGFRNSCREMTLKDIIHFSKNKEDLEAILAAKKYNM
jgi:hypothetical protein